MFPKEKKTKTDFSIQNNEKTDLPLISIIMLTYNRPEFLKRSLKHILAQKNCLFELILIDNGSTDATSEICKHFAEKDSRIRLFSIKKSNIGTGRNIGIDAAKGDYITFVDDDDYMEADMFSYLLRLCEKENADISICGSWYDFDGDIQPFHVFDDTKVYNKIEAVDEFLKRERYNSANPCKFFKRHIFQDIRYESFGLYDDIHTMYKLIATADKVVSSGVPKYYFSRHGKNNSNFALTYALTPPQLDEYLAAFRERTRYLSALIPKIAPRVRYSEWSYMISMIDKIKTYSLDSCYSYLPFLKKNILENFEEFSTSPFLMEKEKKWLKDFF